MTENIRYTEEQIKAKVANLDPLVASYLNLPQSEIILHAEPLPSGELGLCSFIKLGDKTIRFIWINPNRESENALEKTIVHELVHKYHSDACPLVKKSLIEAIPIFGEDDMKNAFKNRVSYSEKLKNYYLACAAGESLAHTISREIFSEGPNEILDNLDEIRGHKDKVLNFLMNSVLSKRLWLPNKPFGYEDYIRTTRAIRQYESSHGIVYAGLLYEKNKDNSENFKKLCQRLIKEPPLKVLEHCLISSGDRIQ